jgi:hypothetical protein
MEARRHSRAPSTNQDDAMTNTAYEKCMSSNALDISMERPGVRIVIESLGVEGDDGVSRANISDKAG